MEPKEKEDLTNQIRDLFQSLLSRGMDELEISIILVQDIIEPAIDNKKDNNEKLAFAHRTSKFYQ